MVYGLEKEVEKADVIERVIEEEKVKVAGLVNGKRDPLIFI